MGSSSRRHSRTGLFSRSRRRRRRARLLALALLLGLVVAVAVVLAVLAIPLLRVNDHAQAARADLVAAKQAIARGDTAAARSGVAQARGSLDDAHVELGSFGARVWGRLPVAGTAVDDVRSLLAAMDEATSMAETGVELYPTMTDDKNGLFVDGRVNLKRLRQAIRQGHVLGRRAVAADEALGTVQGTTPLLGGRILDARDQADEVIGPIADGYRRVGSSLDVLPRALGAHGPTSYLIAIMNPAELRWSGGATLSMTTMHADRGRTSFGQQINLTDITAHQPFSDWEPVAGNPFHTPGENRLANATFNPDWPVSAEELQRAWASGTGQPEMTGVFALDVPALAGLLEVTGPLQVRGYGQVSGDNLVKVLSGSYDDVGPEQTEGRKELNSELATVFRSSLLSGGRYVEKAQALGEAARGRHLAFWSSDAPVQKAFTRLGISGALGSAGHDYLGVFTQNANGSKTDYYQRRALDSTVTLHEDGSARVDLEITVHNDTPPYARPGRDPKVGYWTRYSRADLLQLLPRGATLRSYDGAAVQGTEADNVYDDRPFYRRRVWLGPAREQVVTVSYDVPHAATVTGEGLSYRLVYDPQGMVNPQSLRVHLVPPDGWRVSDLPAGWQESDDGAVLDAGAGDSTGSWTVDLVR